VFFPDYGETISAITYKDIEKAPVIAYCICLSGSFGNPYMLLVAQEYDGTYERLKVFIERFPDKEDTVSFGEYDPLVYSSNLQKISNWINIPIGESYNVSKLGNILQKGWEEYRRNSRDSLDEWSEASQWIREFILEIMVKYDQLLRVDNAEPVYETLFPYIQKHLFNWWKENDCVTMEHNGKMVNAKWVHRYNQEISEDDYQLYPLSEFLLHGLENLYMELNDDNGYDRETLLQMVMTIYKNRMLLLY
jgi:hypothetical protein